MSVANEAGSPPAVRKRGRPPKADGARRETRERLVRCGIALLTEQGFATTGIDEVLKRVGVPKGSFYHYFASKDEFGRAVIEAYAAYFDRKLDRWLLDEAQAPLQRLRNFVADATHGVERYDYRRGCLVGNLSQELASTHEEFRALLEEVFRGWQYRLQRCLEQARDTGAIAAHANCAQLAAYFWIGWEGAILRAKLVRSSAPLRLFADNFFATLPGQAEMPAPGRRRRRPRTG